jgi:hypothetical protein
MDVISVCCREEEEIFLEESQLSSALPSTEEIPRKEKVVLDFQSRKKFIADFDCYFEGGVRTSFGVLTKFKCS